MDMRGLPTGRNPDIAVVIPSTGRPEQCARLVEQIYATARTVVHVTISVEPDDVKPYARALAAGEQGRRARHAESGAMVGMVWDQAGAAGPGSHVAAINRAAASHTERSYCDAHSPRMIVKLDDDHWPVTVGWDRLYLNALDALGGTGVVYGDDLFQRERLATTAGLSTNIVRELGWFAPPVLQHWYCDNFWTELGRRSGRLAYVPGAVIEHRNVQAGKAPDDATYQAGGLNQARIQADRLAWERIIEPRTDWGRMIGKLEHALGTVRTYAAPSQMDVWAETVRHLADQGDS